MSIRVHSWLALRVMAVSASLRALLNQAIDYAGMFPPCDLPLEPALQNHAKYVRSPEAWMLNGFVLPVGQFDAATKFVSQFDPSRPLRVAALGPKTANAEGFLDALKDASTAVRSFSRSDVNLSRSVISKCFYRTMLILLLSKQRARLWVSCRFFGKRRLREQSKPLH